MQLNIYMPYILQMMRMRLGIKSFVEFTNSLVDREAKLMASANRQLREQLSKMDMDKLERVNFYFFI